MENCGRKIEDEEAREYLKRSKGIGRPATRAAIIERLLKTGYIERKKKVLVPTDKGMSAIDAITIEDIKSPILTADWEKALDVIEASNPADSVQELKKFIASIHQTTAKWCEEMKENKVESTGQAGIDVDCPMCGLPMVEGKDNYYCSGYKNGCKMSISKTISGKTISKTMVKTLVEKGKTSKLKGFKSKQGKTFEAKLVLADGYKCPTCNLIQKKGKCYKCGGDLVPDARKIVTLEFDNGKK
jgi:DNA topoisomerase-3